ncbi:MAG: AAA family ATPase, partial [Candidatus Zixiibacteriota bacterium]
MISLKVVGLVGLQGSGKTEVVKAMAEFDAPSVRMGDVVWQEIRRRGLKINEKNVAEVANEFRAQDGMGAIAKRCIPLINEKGKGKRAVLVDGIRGIAEVDEFRKVFGEDFSLISVWATETTRHSRISSRVREDDARGIESFRAKDRRELSWGLGEAMALADYLIVNEGTLAELRKSAIK